MLTPHAAFQTRLADVMETLAKAAVLEISKLVELECKILLSEVTRGQHEIEFLRKRLQLMEKHMSTNHTSQKQEAGNTGTSVLLTSVQENLSSPPENLSSRGDNNSLRLGNSSRTENRSSRNEAQLCIKRESELEEFRGGDAASVDVPVSAEQDLADTREKQHDCPLQQHHGENRTTEVKTEQESLWDAELEGEKARDSINSIEDLHTRRPSDESVDRRSAAISARPQDRLLFENNLHAPEGPSVKLHANSEPESSRAYHLPKPIRRRVASRFHEEKRFVCPLCAKCFKCSSQLEIHKRSHTGEKPYWCSLCGKRYAQKGHLYTHLRTHTGEKPYRCMHCAKAFIQKCSLDMHQRTHTGEKPFICGKCGKGFTKKFNLNKHLAVHSDATSGFSDLNIRAVNGPGLRSSSVDH